jgi:transmembrane serine protease 9
VKAIPLQQNVAPDGQVCTVSGWGYLRDEDLDLPQMLQVVVVPFITYDTCRYFYQNIPYGSIEPGMNCAGYLQGGKDACGVSTCTLFAA